MPKIQAVIRDLSFDRKGEVTIVLAGLTIEKVIIRDHCNIRNKDITPSFKVNGDLKVGSVVEIKADLSDYFDKGQWKKGLTSIRSFTVLAKRG